MSKQFIKSIAQAMKENKTGVRDLARKCGLDASFISKMMQGKRNPPSEENTIIKIAEALAIDPVMLVIYAGRIPSSLQNVFESPAFLKSLSKYTNYTPEDTKLDESSDKPPAKTSGRGNSHDVCRPEPDFKVELL